MAVPNYKDKTDLTEDQRILAVVQALLKGRIISFAVEAEPGKADRYLRKIRQQLPSVQEVCRAGGPHKGMVSVTLVLDRSHPQAAKRRKRGW